MTKLMKCSPKVKRLRIFVGDADGNEAVIGRLSIHFAVDHLVNLPYLNAQTDEAADVDHDEVFNAL